MTGQSETAATTRMTLKRAREEGLLIEMLQLDQIDSDFLVRDRLVHDDDEMASLKVSIKTRGQQFPIEVTKIDSDKAQYGLISGWRRLAALRALWEETQDPAFSEIRALVVEPDHARDAYLAMIEENEIRVNLSFYERARIALRSVHEGVFPDTRAALRGLYASSTRSKRSKIGTFIALVDAFDGVLQHPTAISEKLGLALARELVRDASFASKVSEQLHRTPTRTAHEEMRLLAHSISTAQPLPDASVNETKIATTQRRAVRPPREDTVGTIKMRYTPGKSAISLAGEDVDDAFFDALRAWLEGRRKNR